MVHSGLSPLSEHVKAPFETLKDELEGVIDTNIDAEKPLVAEVDVSDMAVSVTRSQNRPAVAPLAKTLAKVKDIIPL